MQVTIDSTEPLESVLPVINALYNVSLSLPAAAETSTNTRSRSSASTRRKPTGRRNKHAAVTPGTVREWAQANGYAVSSRGRLPAQLLEAYRAAH